MSLLWAVPPVAVAVAAVITLLQLRPMMDAAADLRAELHRIGEVQGAVAQVRAASAETRAAVDALRGR
jgi:hypothetical protein